MLHRRGLASLLGLLITTPGCGDVAAPADVQAHPMDGAGIDGGFYDLDVNLPPDDGGEEIDASSDPDGGTEPDADLPPGDGGPDAGPVTGRPNIVVVMADDLDHASFERALAAGLLPKIRANIVQAGSYFANSFASNPLCCPSRATFLSGRFSHNNDVYSNHPPHGGIGSLRDASTLATWLHAAGYRTGHVGKYLNGYGEDTARTYVPPGWDDWQATIAGSTYRMYDYDVNDNGRVVHYGTAAADYQTDVLAKRAVDFVRESDARNDAQPFFLVVTPLAPHVEVGPPTNQAFGAIRPAPRHVGSVNLALPQAPSFDHPPTAPMVANWNPTWTRDRPFTASQIDDLQKLYRQRIAALRSVDDLVGRLVDTLNATGELANTVLIFMADNGYELGQHRHVGKVVVYEDSIRVPLAIRGPDLARGRTVQQPVVNVDWAPTIAALAGARPTYALDGRSLVPLIRGTAPASWRQRLLIEYGSDTSDNTVPPYEGVRTAPRAARLPNWLFVRYAGPTLRELYSLQDDPYERMSLHGFPGRDDEQSTLRGWLDALQGCAGSACMRAEE